MICKLATLRICMVFMIALVFIGQVAASTPMNPQGEATQFPFENPVGEMEDPFSPESESENDRETDDDNIFSEKRVDLDPGLTGNGTVDPWALSHESPFDKQSSPPPKA